MYDVVICVIKYKLTLSQTTIVTAANYISSLGLFSASINARIGDILLALVIWKGAVLIRVVTQKSSVGALINPIRDQGDDILRSCLAADLSRSRD